MSKRHQASRRRSYGRRQHELHERPTIRLEHEEGMEREDALDLAAAVAARQLAGRFGFGYAD